MNRKYREINCIRILIHNKICNINLPFSIVVSSQSLFLSSIFFVAKLNSLNALNSVFNLLNWIHSFIHHSLAIVMQINVDRISYTRVLPTVRLPNKNPCINRTEKSPLNLSSTTLLKFNIFISSNYLSL